MAINYPQLKSELQIDPASRGYSVPLAAGNHVTTAALVNEVIGSVSIKRADIAPTEILEQLDPADFKSANTQAQLMYFQWVISLPKVALVDSNGADTRIKANMQAMLNNTNSSLTRLASLQTRNGSRGEFLFGAGTVVSADDVARAMRS